MINPQIGQKVVLRLPEEEPLSCRITDINWEKEIIVAEPLVQGEQKVFFVQSWFEYFTES